VDADRAGAPPPRSDRYEPGLPRVGARGGRAAGALLGGWALGVYLFLYAPILVLGALSFNRSRLSGAWEGFTLEWYVRAAANPAVLGALRNSLVVGGVATLVATAIATAAALAVHRHRFRRQGWLEGLLTLPTVAPEIVLAASMLLVFAAVGLRLGFLSVILAHVAFTLSYAFVVVRARVAGLDRSLEEAALDLGATPLQAFLKVTLPAILPAVLAAALLVFALSIDDYVVTSFVAGVGATTLPLQIYSMVRSGVSPEINAVSSVLLLATALLLLAAFLLEQGRRPRLAALPGLVGLAVLGAPFALPGAPEAGARSLNLYIWSGYIAPETLARFEGRHGVRVNVDLFDSNEALLAKLQAGNAGYDVVCPSDYSVQVLLAQGLLRALDHSALPHFANLDPRFVDRAYDPGNRHSVPYFWGTAGIAYDRRRVAGPVDSWQALWDPRYAGRILMLDDAREALGAALKRRGLSLNATDRRQLEAARDDLLLQKPLVRAYNSSNFEDVLLAGDVWLAHGWSGQFAKAMDQNPEIAYVVPREGATFFIDNLAIPKDARSPALAHAFIDFTLEAEVAAEICRTMRYSSPNRAALALLPSAIRANPAVFPPADVVERLEMIRDLGEATVLYDRLWTEVKTR
jgi:spermidine/putrescine transport system permease protein